MEEKEKEIKIPHRRASNHAAHFVTGALLAGPTPDGLHHLTFFSDALVVGAETGRHIDSNNYSTSVEANDLESFREDKVTLTVTEDVLIRISEMFQRKFLDLEKAKPGK